MAQLDKIETTLDDVLRKRAPVQLPADARNWIARNMWWIALITGVCLLWSAITLWQAGHTIDRFAQIYSAWAGRPYVHHLGMAYYLSLLAIGATGVVSLLAAVNLKDMRRSGWLYLFYAFLLHIVSSLCLLFSDYGGGFSRFLGTLISAAIGGYFLFQIREHFTKLDTATTTHIPPVATHPTHRDEPEDTAGASASEAADESATGHPSHEAAPTHHKK